MERDGSVTMQFLGLAIVIVVSNVLLTSSAAQTNDGKKPDTKEIALENDEENKRQPVVFESVLQLQGGVVRRASGHSHGSVDLGALKPATRYRLKLTLVNSGSQQVEFDSVSTTCSCSSILPSKGTIVPNENSKFVVDFKTPVSIINSKFSFAIQLKLNRKNEALLNFSGWLAGNLHVESNFGFVVKEGINEYSIPFVFTEPINFEDLEVSFSKSIEDTVIWELKKLSDTSGAIVLLLDSDRENKQFMSGQVKLLDANAGKLVSAEIVFRRKAVVSVSPLVIRFFEVLEEDSKRTKATAILQIDEKYLPPGESLPSLECELEGNPIQVNCVRMRNGIYRLNFLATGFESGSKFHSLSLKILTNKISRTLDLSAIIERQ